MSVETAVRSLLIDCAPVTLLVGKRIHPMQAPQSSIFPAVTYSDASRKTVMTFDGPVLTDRYGMTLQTYGTSYGSVKAAAGAVRTRLLGYAGEVSGGRVLGIFDEDESDGLDTPLHDEERGIFYVTLSLTVWYRATS